MEILHGGAAVISAEDYMLVEGTRRYRAPISNVSASNGLMRCDRYTLARLLSGAIERFVESVVGTMV